MEILATLETAPPSKPRTRRLIVLFVVGLTAIIVSLGVRNSTWAKERRLKNLVVEDLALSIHDEPNDPLTFLYYGSALLKANDLPDSEQAFERATQLDPRMARAFLGLGSVQFRRGELPAAQKTFETAVTLDPKSTDGYLGLAQVYYQQGMAAHAAAPLQKIVALEPKNAPAWYFLGKMYGEAHESDKALEALQKATQYDPKQGIYWRDLGQLERHYSRNAEAEKALTTALHYSPNDSVGYLWLGQLYAQMGDSPKLRGQAEQCFLSAIARDPKMQDAYLGLGQLYQRSSNYSAAVTYFRKAFELDNSDSQALLAEGQCLVQLGRKAEGQQMIAGAQALETAKRDLDYMQKRILAEPKTRELRLRMARLYRKYENYTDAIGQYQAYQRLGPVDPIVEKELNDYGMALQKQGLLRGNAPPPAPVGSQ